MTREVQSYAKVIADSVNHRGDRVTTMEVCFRRFVLAEFNTHRLFSRNSASSRAIPVSKMLDRVINKIALPVEWPTEQKGMQGGPPLGDAEIPIADVEWKIAGRDAVKHVRKLVEMGVHKSVANRLLEPFLMHTVVVTSTHWKNFFEQRCSPLAQPEIREVAELMQAAYDASTPQLLGTTAWHLPYLDDETRAELVGQFPGEQQYWRTAAKVSAARCARVSYLTQDGKRDIEEDVKLYDRLVGARPAHWSPLEHVATPWQDNRLDSLDLAYPDYDGNKKVYLKGMPAIGNLVGWRQLRTTVETELGQTTVR